MDAPDARTRSKISLAPAKVLSKSIPSALLPQIFLSNLVLVAALHAGKDWLLHLNVGIFWTVLRVLAVGGLVVLVWEGMTGQLAKRKNIEWSALALASLLLFVQMSSLFTALFRLSTTRVVLFTHFSTLWFSAVMEPTSVQKPLLVGGAFLLSFGSSLHYSSGPLWEVLLSHTMLIFHGISSTALDHTQGVLSTTLGQTFTVAATTLGASLIGIPLYTIRKMALNWPPTPALPLQSLAALPFLAYALLYRVPKTTRSLSNLHFGNQYFILSYPSALVLGGLVGYFFFTDSFTWTDIAVGALLYYGMYPQDVTTLGATPRTPTSRLIRSYMKTILSNPESRKIFYFLMLNMCYMLVQMLYGVWTNSLGLISDAIHMAFDCMAIGVGLFASVMATWPPNERFTYGYGRIETLSGFANGIFLILISIFIVFEAIQRLMEPPEMNTNQLLLVSSLGLAVNLFGMFAMGGHHHGGHSHSHGHSHTETHSPHSDHSEHSHVHHEDHNHSHSHSEPEHQHPIPQHHSHSHSHDESHLHSHSQPDPSSHSHSHDDHGHSHDDHGHSHDDHGHSHEDHGHSHGGHDDPHIHHAPEPLHSHSHNHDGAAHDPGSPDKGPKRHFRGPSLLIHAPDGSHHGHSHDHHDDHPPLATPSRLLAPHIAETMSPITPSYRFGHDDHYEAHHTSSHAPNLHAPNLHDHAAHEHGHEGHSHNMRGVFLHVMADTLGSVGVIISTLLIQFYGWTGFDPIASLFIAILIAASVIPLVIDTGKVLCLDVAERETSIEKALSELPHVEGLSSFTAPRFWPKDASSLIGSIHIQIAPSRSSYDPTGPHSSKRVTYANIDRVVERVDTLLRSKISGLEELTIQVEEAKTGPVYL
ncbi:hypothetical protein PLICRDRAFT_44173 [Plicaturopsis crispa FD-325 SS-3]|nr:hypothetical protein PLICRDRAFT_44173 [Plicaturopsis crispa FD-325 SS-3]